MIINILFDEVKKSFPEIKSKIKPFNKESFMFSSPYSTNIYYNPNQIKKFRFSKTAIKGVIAHELSHKVTYKDINIIERILFKWRYKNFDFKKKIEREADRIAVKHGFGRELKQLIKESKLKFSRERFLKIKGTHLTIKEIDRMMHNK